MFFIAYMWWVQIMSLLPVAVTNISILSTTSSRVTTSNPSIKAYKAQIGSISATNTLAPLFFIDIAEPFPTSPYPHTSTFLPAIITSVALFKASGRECLQP